MAEGPIAVLRLTDSSGEQLVCCCAPSGGVATVMIGDEQSEYGRPVCGIVIDSTGPIEITNPKDASAVAAWLSAAAVWLRVQQLQDKEVDHGRDDG